MAKYYNWLTEDGLLKIQGWAMDGLTDEQIAHNMGIRRSTLYEWRKKFTSISDTLKKSKEVADRAVENSLYKRATGYFEVVEKREKREHGVVVESVIITKQIPPDVTAMIFWLKNRKPDVWRDKTETAITETNGVLESLMALHNGKRNVE
jgi:transcriptional regulator with XRE-family HTH domain